ncbi:hypothetical protein [Comamonas terrigena]|uniref:hypothetical protein n=2 Tax=Comamonas terrigena TaxID=32013 RepID=UPI0024494FCC|nr:hypothetical protein [Comamonas terrigena]MDH0048605.1 hypothetical protein [Comamonas terrigena]MDH0511585.1 hypothetical protein [Comamonas terrigena]
MKTYHADAGDHDAAASELQGKSPVQQPEGPRMKSFESIASNAYQAFRNSIHDGHTAFYSWAELSQETREAWLAAVRKVAEEVQHVH